MRAFFPLFTLVAWGLIGYPVPVHGRNTAEEAPVGPEPRTGTIAWCAQKLSSLRTRSVRNFVDYKRTREQKIADFFPDYANARQDPNGSLILPKEQVEKFREAVERYLKWRIRREGHRGMADLEAWLRETNKEPFPLLTQANLESWIQRGLTLDQMMNEAYELFQNKKYLERMMRNRSIVDVARNINARNVGGWAWDAAKAVGDRVGNAIIGAPLFVLAGAGWAYLGTWYFGVPLSLDAAKEQATRLARDTSGIKAQTERFQQLREAWSRMNYFEEAPSRESWQEQNEKLFNVLVQLQMERRKLNEDLRMPASLRNAPQNFETQYPAAVDRVRAAQAQLARIREERERFIAFNSDAEEKLEQGIEQDSTRRLGEINHRLREAEDNEMRFRAQMTTLLAAWQLSNTYHRAIREGTIRAERLQRNSGDDSPIPPSVVLEAERETLRVRVQQFQREFRNFNRFAFAHSELLKDWNRELLLDLR